MTFFVILEILGTLAFAISGIRLASAKRFDWFGAYVVGFTTAVGGGTLRDLMLSVTPFWMLDITYLIVTAAAMLIVVGFGRYLIRLNNTFFIFDAIGLGLFTVVGIEKTLAADFSLWVAVIMGTITGAAGGVLQTVGVNIGGTFSSPKITLGVKEAVEEAVKNVVDQQIQQLTGSASLSEEVQKQAENLRREAKNAGDKLIEAAQAQRTKLVEAAAPKGALAKLAAEKAGDKLVSEAEKQAAALTAEAEKQIDRLTSKAE